MRSIDPAASLTQTSCLRPSPPSPPKRKRKPAGTPDPGAEVVVLSPTTLMESDKYVCEICNQAFQRDQNLQMHRRRHRVPWKLLKREQQQQARKRVYVCPEPSCLHHEPSHALGDLVGIKKHYRRKHSSVKQWQCDRCSKAYAVHSDYKAHLKTCGTRGHCCDCGRVFSRVESFIEHQDACAATTNKRDGALIAMPSARTQASRSPSPIATPSNASRLASSGHKLGIIDINMPPILARDDTQEYCRTTLIDKPMQPVDLTSNRPSTMVTCTLTVLAPGHSAHDDTPGYREISQGLQIFPESRVVLREEIKNTELQLLPTKADNHLLQRQRESSQSSATTFSGTRKERIKAMDIAQNPQNVMLCHASNDAATFPSCKLQLSISLGEKYCDQWRCDRSINDVELCSSPPEGKYSGSEFQSTSKTLNASSNISPIEDISSSEPSTYILTPGPETAIMEQINLREPRGLSSLSNFSSSRQLQQLNQQKQLFGLNETSVTYDYPRSLDQEDHEGLYWACSMSEGSTAYISSVLHGSGAASTAQKLLIEAREKLRRASAEKLEAEKARKEARREREVAEAERASAQRIAHHNNLLIRKHIATMFALINDSEAQLHY